MKNKFKEVLGNSEKMFSSGYFVVIGFVEDDNRDCFFLFLVFFYMIYFVIGENGNWLVGKGIFLGEKLVIILI